MTTTQPEPQPTVTVANDAPQTAFAIAQALNQQGQPIIILAIRTPYGTLGFPLDGQTARTLGRQLQQAGSAAASGLILAT